MVKNKKNKKNFFKKIGAVVCAVAVAMVAFLVPFKSHNPSKLPSASADSNISTFYGSDLNLFFTAYYEDGQVLVDGLQSVSNLALILRPDVSGVIQSFNVSGFFQVMLKVSGQDAALYTMENHNFDVNVSFDGHHELSFEVGDLGAIDAYCFFYYWADSGFLCDVRQVNLYTTFVNNQDYYSFIEYVDVNGRLFKFALKMTSSVIDLRDITLQPRSYYLIKPSDNDYYAQGYNAGYSLGHADGYAQGESSGYNEGYSAGNTVGYNNGYSAGVEDGGDYTFFSLVSAVIDAPIQAFMGLFNFELLGVNLAGFFTGLMTLAFIVTIVRLVMP